ncbi:MAG: glycoside hydrolase family 127 protein [Bacteroidaceae bacterium]|nr:glycoside hydrolase family 127 protein [Bacteroidaceae bacterium]
MKNNPFLIAALCLTCTAGTAFAQPKSSESGGYPINPVPFTSVKVTDQFWGQRLQASREVTIPLAFSKCEETGRYDNFTRSALMMELQKNPALKDDPRYAEVAKGVKVSGYSFDDTDVYKTIEGASYLLQTYPDKKLKRYIDSVLVIVASAQEPDGYLYTSRTQNPAAPHEWAGNKRWVKVEDLSHEFYNLGHMVEGAIAHYQATGQRNFLDIAIRYADCIYNEIGEGEGKQVFVPGHQIAEMALAKLYTVTGEKKYLDLAKFFLDKRGYTSRRDEYSQAHLPVVEQSEAVGHAVRAAYMYSGMADVAALTGDSAYIRAIGRIWDNIVGKKLYITGGIGATASGEAFGKNYELHNMSAYCETCAAIGNVYMNYRLFLLHGESKYYDVLERSLYNGLISGVSLEGNGFFYPNPLESMGQHQRQAWFGCACCPSNICRFIPSLPGYVYAVKDESVYVNLFVSNTATLKVGGKKLTLTQQTGYPWDGAIALTIDRATGRDFTLKLRIPGWVKGQVVPSDLYSYADNKRLGYTVTVNGKPVEKAVGNDGYLAISRRWKKGDRIELALDMQPRTVKAHSQVAADRGRLAIERGPIVYCAEWPDNDFDIMTLLLNREPKFEEVRRDDMLHGITQLKTQAQTLNYDGQGRLQAKDVTLTLIPYYAWAHRGSGKMSVWLPANISATRPGVPPTAASQSKVDASIRTSALSSINDGLLPQHSNDRAVPYYHTWPKQAGTEWLTYTFPKAMKVSACTLYWFDDGPWGGCRIPKAWRILYKNERGEWVPVKNLTPYPCSKNETNTVQFAPVSTTALKLEIDQPDEHSIGVYEWEVK